MRPRLLILAGIALLIVAALAAIVVFDGDGDGLGELVLTTAVDPRTNAPVDDVTSFSSDAEAIYATLAVKDQPAGETFVFRWRQGDAEPVETRYALPEKTDGWVFGALDLEPGSLVAADDYVVEVYNDGDLIERRQFSITE